MAGRRVHADSGRFNAYGAAASARQSLRTPCTPPPAPRRHSQPGPPRSKGCPSSPLQAAAVAPRPGPARLRREGEGRARREARPHPGTSSKATAVAVEPKESETAARTSRPPPAPLQRPPLTQRLQDQCHWIELTSLPAAWSSSAIERMCKRYGDILGLYRDDKTDGQFRVGYPLREIATTAVKSLNAKFAGRGVAATAKFLPSSTTQRQKAFVDELLASNTLKGWEPESEAAQRRELFLWNLPDLLPAKLFLWLQGGSKQDLDCRVPFEPFESHEWLGKCGYVRFQKHESAARMLLEIPQRPEKCRAAWSFSERLIAWRETAQSIVQEAELELQCQSLQLLGDGLKQRLCFEWKGAAADLPATRSGLKDRLQSALESAMARPCVLVRGLAKSWTENSLKVLFAFYGGTSTVNMVRSETEVSCYVQLKDAANSEKFVVQWDGKHVGDDESGLERCQISCQIVPSTQMPPPQASSQTSEPGTRTKAKEEGVLECECELSPAKTSTRTTRQVSSKQKREVFTGQPRPASKQENLPARHAGGPKPTMNNGSAMPQSGSRSSKALLHFPDSTRTPQTPRHAKRGRVEAPRPASEATPAAARRAMMQTQSAALRKMVQERRQCTVAFEDLGSQPVHQKGDLVKLDQAIERLRQAIEDYMRTEGFDRALVDACLRDGESCRFKLQQEKQRLQYPHRSRSRRRCSQSRSASRGRATVVLKPRID